MNVAKKKYHFQITVTREVAQLLRILHDLGVIRRFCRLDGNLYRIYPNWYSVKTTFRHIKVFSHTKNPLRLTLKSLRVLKTNIGLSNLVLNTPHGLLTHRQALKLQTGGHLLCILF